MDFSTLAKDVRAFLFELATLPPGIPPVPGYSLNRSWRAHMLLARCGGEGRAMANKISACGIWGAYWKAKEYAEGRYHYSVHELRVPMSVGHDYSKLPRGLPKRISKKLFRTWMAR